MRFPIGDADVVCIDWDERTLRAVEAGVARGGVKLRSAVQAPFDAGADRDPGVLGEQLRRTLGEHRIRARRAVLAVPRQEVVLNLMSLPKGTQDELAAMVHIQIAKELPFAKDQTVIDFAVAPAGDGPNVDVWVAAVRNQVIDHYRQVLNAAGLRPERLGLRPYANLAAINRAIEPTGRTLLVDIGPALTEIDVIRDGRLAYSRAATVTVPPVGLAPSAGIAGPAAGGSAAAHGSDDEAASWSAIMDTLLVEVSRTIGAYRSTDPEARIDRIVLAGSVGIDESVVKAFHGRFNVPTQVFSVPPTLRWRGTAEAAPFSAAIGMALSAGIENLQYFNLLAPKEPEGERRERIRRVPYRAAIIAALATVTVAAAYVPIHKRNSELKDLASQIAVLNQDKPARDELRGFEEALKGWEKQGQFWIDHLKRLADVFPRTEQAYISKVDFKENGEIHLSLQVKDEFQAGKLARSINEIKDDSKSLYAARVGLVKTNPQTDTKYPMTDQVIVQIKSAVPVSAARR